MGLLHVPFGSALVYLRVQVLQAEDVPAMYQQGVTRFLFDFAPCFILSWVCCLFGILSFLAGSFLKMVCRILAHLTISFPLTPSHLRTISPHHLFPRLPFLSPIPITLVLRSHPLNPKPAHSFQSLLYSHYRVSLGKRYSSVLFVQAMSIRSVRSVYPVREGTNRPNRKAGL